MEAFSIGEIYFLAGFTAAFFVAIGFAEVFASFYEELYKATGANVLDEEQFLASNRIFGLLFGILCEFGVFGMDLHYKAQKPAGASVF